MKIPTIGYGITNTTDEVAYVAVSKALEAGYRVINTCAAYGNERGIGKAIAKSSIPRKELTIVALDSNSRRSAENARCFDGYKAELNQIYDSLDCLQVNHIDCYMINWPVPRYMENVWQKLNADSWCAIEECVERGFVKHAGVSNFLPNHLEALQRTAKLPIEVNQLEIHPQFQQRETVSYCRKHGMDIMAWSPLFKGKAVQLPTIHELAAKHGKTPAQIILRWDIQHDVSPVVCSQNEERILQNINIYDFELTLEDMLLIDGLETGEHVDVFSYKRQLVSLGEKKR